MTSWSAEDSKKTYRLDNWGEGYVDVGQKGQILIRPYREASAGEIDMQDLLVQLEQQSIDLPVLVRFQDILKDRINLLCSAFKTAFEKHQYQTKYTAVYPIKVNQQFSVVSEILNHGGNCVGLEAGSKPELMAVLSLAEVDKHVIICNGYKDHEYIRLALIARRLGHEIVIVLEKTSELAIVIAEAKKLNVQPLLGVRLKLASMGKGKWQNTGGEKAKFGLTATQIIEVVEQLKSSGYEQCLQLLHFHMGSQIANLSDIKNGLAEAAQYYAELMRMGININILDIGGGVGVDYEGGTSTAEFSVNYDLNDYADAVISCFASLCKNNDFPQPNIITEVGRAMTAHHAVLITEVINAEQRGQLTLEERPESASKNIKLAYDLYEKIQGSDPISTYQKINELITKAQRDFINNLFSIDDRSLLEKIILACYQCLKNKLQHDDGEQQDVLNDINEKLADKLVCNFSVFQSVPDIWGIAQIFPIVPLQYLNKKPDRRAIIQDLTCDSDGQIERYVDAYGIETSLPVHLIKNDEKYRLGIFMVGAYQEILGDMHNLFGDTNTINVEIDANKKVKLTDPESGDTVLELLNYVHFDTDEMMRSYKKKVRLADLSEEESAQFLSELNNGLHGYTYLE